MAVDANDRRSGPWTLTAGQTGPHSFDFVITAPEDLRVTRERSGAETLMVLNTDYSVSVSAYPGTGTITLLSGVLAGDILTVDGWDVDERPTPDFISTRLDPEDLNTELDHCVRRLQEVRRDAGNALRGPRSETAPDAVPPAATRAGRVLAGDADGFGWDTEAPLASDLRTLVADRSSIINKAAALDDAAVYRRPSIESMKALATSGSDVKFVVFIQDESAGPDRDDSIWDFLPDNDEAVISGFIERPTDRPTGAGRFKRRSVLYPANIETPYDLEDAVALSFNKHRPLGKQFKSPAEASALALRQRHSSATLTSAQEIADDTDAAISWQSLESGWIGAWAVGSPTRFTVPDDMHGARMRLHASVQFESGSTGYRKLFIKKNGSTAYRLGAKIVAAVSGAETIVDLSSCELRAKAGDYYELFVRHTQGAALDVEVSFNTYMSIEFEGVSTDMVDSYGDIYQGDYALAAAELPAGYTQDAKGLAKKFAESSIFLPTHLFTLPVYGSGGASDIDFPGTDSGCADTKYAFIRELLFWYRVYRPDGRVFAYVSAAADGPDDSTCGYEPPAKPWASLPTTDLPNVRAWIEAIAALPADIRPDGIFFDIVADFSNGGWINSTIRDLCYSIAREHGFSIMANAVNPSFINVAFAAVGLGPGDFLMFEGFKDVAGVDSTSATTTAVEELDKLRHKGVSLYALGTSEWNVAPTPTQIADSRALFNSLMSPGDRHIYKSADLGLARPVNVNDGPN